MAIGRPIQNAGGAGVDDGYIRALLAERAGYAARGRLHKVAEVDAELARHGVRADRPETTVASAPLETTAEPRPEPEHAGGGWYEIPGKGRVRGRDAAIAALADAPSEPEPEPDEEPELDEEPEADEAEAAAEADVGEDDES